MRVAIFVLAALATLIPATTATTQEHIEYPWCANYSGGSDGGGGSNCGFTSYEQCKETVWGMGGFCDPNPFYKGPLSRATRPPHKRKNG
jgi:Protein of unknown function (DUF3551)